MREFFKRPSLLVNWKSVWGLLFVVSVVWSLKVAHIFQGDLINTGGWSLVFRFLVAAFSPDFSPEFLLITLDATLKTLAYGVCGTFFCMVIGLVGGVLSSFVWWKSSLSGDFQVYWLAVRGILAIPRAIHELIWGLFFINIFGLDPLVAVLAIAIPFGAITAKVFSEILDETSHQPLLALLNSGVSPLNAFTYSLIPQALPNLVSYGFYRFECSIRSAAVLGIIGAGGLGYQIFLSLQSLHYEQMWTLIFALLLLSGGTDFFSGLLRQRLGLASRLDLNVLNIKRQVPLHRDLVVNLSLIGGVVLLIFSFWYIKADFTKLWSPRTIQLLFRVIHDAFPPDLSQLSQMFTLSEQTLAMSILASTAAGLGGILLSFPAARNLKKDEDMGGLRKISFWVTRFILLFMRGIPEPIWALIFLFVLFPGILPGAIALGLHNLGILGRLMAEVIENLDERPINSLKALGASSSQVFLYSILPLSIGRFLAYILYRWEVCIRATVIVGLVGAGGLGRLLTEQISSFDYKGLLTTLIVFLGLTFVVDIISALLRRALR
ncbi:ABC transporter permease subunit [Aetokthonos hydrillicola Thurmond2011]|jgi:phosphonate transport system permease protein|uniref:ABC transporter permease subunit n=1 Tax=Aetokthonos hydrillicola Thurmond2011 TaxID=2712845 RepID=A0AAP5IDF8_9CYAN|nr:ABC transporter permease subunit [Aetokthonos hydrillicola]MBO3462725.1 ABC transporter permease subunit [Aetokthonos hydrillicola CCALA 1050]MBW4585239.1 ABC transporter permease subunit [Aetokthonos hydrillicola CCALA 1050]MDR9899576.1 ABC transporter permease subunit [Aetokthonos hydrillicola Thurmond2011]